MNREEAREELTRFIGTFECPSVGAIEMAIEALSQPNYETDTEVRLAVTNRKKEKVILWDAYGEVEYYPIESLSADRPTELLKDGTLKVNVNNGAEVNRVLVWGDDGCGGLYYADDRPSGEWVESLERNDMMYWHSYSGYCTNCGGWSEYLTPYCGECGAEMYALDGHDNIVCRANEREIKKALKERENK